MGRSWWEKKTISEERFTGWQESHAETCSATTTCSSPAMESEASAMIWGRSEELNGLCYTTYIGDGDSKGYLAAKIDQSYGPEIEIIKEQCICHVQK